MNILQSAMVGALCGAAVTLLPACKSNSVLDRFANTPVVAMLASDVSTDETLKVVFSQTNSILIREGVGGRLNGMLETLEYLDQHPEKTVIIDGPCASACTLLLGKPNNVMFTERAVFRFHSVSWRYLDDLDSPIALSLEGNLKMMEVLPAPVREWVVENNALASLDLTDMDFATAKRLLPHMVTSSKQVEKIF